MKEYLHPGFFENIKKYSNNKIYREYLRTIIVLFIAPMILLMLLAGITASVNYENNERYNNEQLLSQMASDIDTKVNYLAASASKVYKNKQIVKLCKDDGIISTMEIHNILFTYGNEMYSNLCYYDKERGKIHSSNNTVRVDRFLEHMYPFDGFDTESLLYYLGTNKIEFVPVKMEGRDYFLLVIPPRVENVTGTENCIFFVVDVQNFIRNGTDRRIYILNHKKQAINAEGLAEEKIKTYYKENGGLCFDGGLFRVTNYACISSGLELMMLTPMKPGMVNLLIALSIILLILIFGGFCLISVKYMMNLTYGPIARMIEMTETQISTTGNELASIGKTVSDILKKNKSLTEQMHHIGKEEFYILSLLSGKNKADAGMMIEDGRYFVAVVTVLKNSLKIRNQRIDDIVEAIKNNYLEKRENIIYVLNSIVLVLTEDEEKYQKIEMIKKAFNQESLLVTIGVGREVNDKRDISKSYVEAMAALEYKFMVGGDKIIYFEEIGFNKTDSVDCKENLSKETQQLKVFLRNADTARSLELVERIVDDIKSGKVPLFVAKCVCYEIVSIFIDIINEINKSNEAGIDEYIETLSLMNIETAEQLVVIVENFCRMYNEAVAGSRRDDSAAANAVEEYIRCNMTDYNLTVRKIADELHFSASYLSRIFKEKKGISISEYIRRCQIETVKRLLIETDKPINEIISSIGQANVSNYIRKFKSITGYTPGEYRKAFGKK